MKTLPVVIAAVALGGCSFAARSTTMYQADTTKLLEGRVPQVRACYDEALKGDAALKGLVTIRFNVEHETGAIKDAAIDKAKTTAPDVLATCALKSLEGLVLAPGDARDGEASFAWEFGVGLVAASDAKGPRGTPAAAGKSSGGAIHAQYTSIHPSARFAKGTGNTVRATVLGVIDPATSHPIELKPGETLHISEDGKDMPLTLIPRDPAKNDLPIDLVFIVDNSSSMGEEADSIARGIIAFAKLLGTSGLDARFAIAGQNGKITGGIDFDGAPAMEGFLNRPGKKGTSRTVGFGGANAAKLEGAAKDEGKTMSSQENGISGVVFAEKHFGWRPNVQRIFINFTDEATQPSNKPEWSTKILCERWTAASGTIHNVWSGPKLDGMKWKELKEENPAELSKCTPGGVVMSVRNDAADLDLTTLPMTDALRSSVVVEYASADAAKAHEIVISVKGAKDEGKSTLKDVKY